MCALSLLRLPHLWRAWALALGGATLSLLPLAIGRGKQLAFATEGRYLVECLPFVCAGISVGWRIWREQTLAFDFRPLQLFAASAIIICLVATTSCFSLARYVERGLIAGLMRGGREFREHVQQIPSGKKVAVADGMVPTGVAWPGGRWSVLSEYVQCFRSDVEFDLMRAAQLIHVDTWGHLSTYDKQPAVIVSGDSMTQFNFFADSQFIKLPCHDSAPASLIEITWRPEGQQWVHAIGDGYHEDSGHAKAPGVGYSAYPTALVFRHDAVNRQCGIAGSSAVLKAMKQVRVSGLTPVI